jgi:hypothetical protein
VAKFQGTKMFLPILVQRQWELRLWAFLNSSFGLWVLSSVLLAGATWLYSLSQAHNTEVARKAEVVRRLDAEIGNRLWEARRQARENKIEVDSLWSPKQAGGSRFSRDLIPLPRSAMVPLLVFPLQ